MADVVGLEIADLTAAGTSDDGDQVWITHRLGDGSEYSLIYPYEAVGYLITVLTGAARSAYGRRAAQNPQEAAGGMDSNVIAIQQARVGTPKDNSGAILHLTTTDKIPLAAELPTALIQGVIQQLQDILDQQNGTARAGTWLH
jgi:hypothetical protein